MTLGSAWPSRRRVWVDWFNNRRLHTACADLTPVEYEQVHYRQHPALAETLVPTSEWDAPGSMESSCWISCHGDDAGLELYR